MKCCVASCKQSSESLQKVTFHEFPVIQWLRQSWLESTGMKDSHLPPDAAVCSLHFQKDNFTVTTQGTVKLRPNSIPSVFKLKSTTGSSATSLFSSSGQFCMICLDADCKLYPLGKYLAMAYTNVTGISKNLICDKSSESKLCTECAQRLINCHKFKEKTLKTHKLLLLLNENHGMLTLEKVKTINRVGHQLTSNIIMHTIEPDHCDLHLKEDLEENINIQEGNEIKTEIDDGSILNSQVKLETSECEIVLSCKSDSDDSYVDVNVKTNEINNDESIESDLEYTYDDMSNVDIDIDNDNLEDFKTVSWDSDKKADFLNYDDRYSDVECLDFDIDHVVQNLNQGMNNAVEKKAVNIEQNVDKTMSKSPDKTVIKQLIVCCEDIIKLRSKADVQNKPKTRENSEQTNGNAVRTSRSRKFSRDKDLKDYWKIFKVVSLSREEQFAEIEKRKETDKNLPYQCNVCYKGFLDNKTFTKHMERHTDKFGLFECAVCRLRLKSKKSLSNHFRTIHSVRYSCTKCPFVSTLTQSAKIHKRRHEGLKYKCQHCRGEFLGLSTYMLHIRIKHPSDFVCNLCGYSFIGQKGIVTHMSIKHNGENTKDLDGPTCEECDIRFASVTAYEQHMKVSPKHAAADKLKRNCAPKKRDYKRSKIWRDPRPRFSKAECEQCGVVLEGARSYFLHFRKHHPDKNRTKYPHGNAMCEQCGKVFQSLTHLRLHMPYHAEQKQFICDVCDKRFALKSNLAVHIAVHMQKRCKCTVCGKFLSNKTNLWKHMFLHQEPRPSYACVVCDKTFTTAEGRHEHVKHVHGNVPYKRRVRGPRPGSKTRAERGVTCEARVTVQ